MQPEANPRGTSLTSAYSPLDVCRPNGMRPEMGFVPPVALATGIRAGSTRCSAQNRSPQDRAHLMRQSRWVRSKVCVLVPHESRTRPA